MKQESKEIYKAINQQQKRTGDRDKKSKEAKYDVDDRLTIAMSKAMKK